MSEKIPGSIAQRRRKLHGDGRSLHTRSRSLGRHCLAGLLAVVSAMSPFVMPPAFAQDKPIQLKLSHWLPPSHPLQQSWTEWAEDIKRQSNGTITSVIFPSEQLGKAFDHYDMARDGIADFTFVNAGYQPGRFPIAGAGELPFLFGNATGGTAALDTWYRKYAAKEMGDVHYCFAFAYDPATIMSRHKIEVPADMKGLKVRPSNATLANYDTLLGATNVQASAPGARDLLDRGTADAVTTPWHSAFLFGYDKVVHYAIDMKLATSVLVWVMNKHRYETMSAAQQKVIDDHCTTDWAVKIATPWAQYEMAGVGMFEHEPGQTLVKPTPDEIELWRKSAEPLTAQWAQNVRKVGMDPDQILGELKSDLVKFKAAY